MSSPLLLENYCMFMIKLQTKIGGRLDQAIEQELFRVTMVSEK